MPGALALQLCSGLRQLNVANGRSRGHLVSPANHGRPLSLRQCTPTCEGTSLDLSVNGGWCPIPSGLGEAGGGACRPKAIPLLPHFLGLLSRLANAASWGNKPVTPSFGAKAPCRVNRWTGRRWKSWVTQGPSWWRSVIRMAYTSYAGGGEMAWTMESHDNTPECTPVAGANMGPRIPTNGPARRAVWGHSMSPPQISGPTPLFVSGGGGGRSSILSTHVGH